MQCHNDRVRVKHGQASTTRHIPCVQTASVVACTLRVHILRPMRTTERNTAIVCDCHGCHRRLFVRVECMQYSAVQLYSYVLLYVRVVVLPSPICTVHGCHWR
jgi:hypothetical protein